MINQLTFTRFIAAILIVFYHFGDYLLRYNIYFIDVLRPKLNLGVSYFYVLSGFVMMVAYGNRDKVNFKQYYINRFARIYPLHILGTLSFIAVALWLSLDGFKSFQFELSALISHLFLIQAWIPKLSLSLNIPAWSISVEAFFYLLFPLIYNRFIRKTNKKTIFSVIIIFWIICQFAFNWYFLSSHYGGYKSLDRYFLSYNPFFHLNSFLVGILFGYFYINNKEKHIGKFDFAIIGVGVAMGLLVYFFNSYFFHNGLLAPFFGIFILLLAYNKGFITKLFNRPQLIYLGEISFAVYLLQQPVFDFAHRLFPLFHLENAYIHFAIGTAMLIFASHLSYKFVEVPLRDRIRKWGK